MLSGIQYELPVGPSLRAIVGGATDIPWTVTPPRGRKLDEAALGLREEAVAALAAAPRSG